MRTFTTIDAIVDHVLGTWSIEDLIYVAEMSHDFAGMVGREIRNSYGLWTDSPLTEQWRTKPETRVIKLDIDFSEDHPDAVSAKVVQRLKERIDVDELKDKLARRLALRAKVDQLLAGGPEL